MDKLQHERKKQSQFCCKMLGFEGNLQYFATPSFCQIHGRIYLAMLDAFLNFVNIERSHSTSVTDVICSLLQLLLDLPTFVTDTASCFTSDAFKRFLERHGIRHILTPPYHSQSNCAAESDSSI